MRWPGADRSVVARKALQWGWSEGTGSDNHRFETTGDRMTSSAMKDKPFKIDKRQVYKAYKAVKSNQGAAGVDGQTLQQFETDWKRNLYRIWNRMSSGSYFPPPVRAVSIPKKSGGERILGVPTVSDRIAQVVVKQLIETEMENIFLPDSYGYRPGKSALDAVGVMRERCWRYDTNHSSSHAPVAAWIEVFVYSGWRQAMANVPRANVGLTDSFGRRRHARNGAERLKFWDDYSYRTGGQRYFGRLVSIGKSANRKRTGKLLGCREWQNLLRRMWNG
jgi:Reverse transcriptase (RNA-dependent DNA polymerase)